MISLQKLLSQNNESGDTLMHVIRLLVEGIGQNAADGDVDDGVPFRESIELVSQAIAKEVPPSALLIHVGAVLKALEDHTRRAGKRRKLQTAELQNMVKMCTSTMSVVSSASNANVSRLGEIEKQLATAAALDDVRVIKTRLSECLADIQQESERQRRETDETIQQLTRGLEQARAIAANAQENEGEDNVTGLPSRREAELALAKAASSGVQTYAAVMVLDRLQILNVRFGREAGDDILRVFSQMVRKQLTSVDRLFRWQGPVLLALMPRPGTLEHIRIQVNRIMETKLEHTIQTPSRSVMLPISARWTLIPMMAAPRLMYQKIDAFAAGPAGRD